MEDRRLGAYIVYVITFLLIIYVRINFPIDHFADYNGYALSLENLLSAYSEGWFQSEPLGWAPLIFFYYITGSLGDALFWANMSLTAIFFVSMLYVGEHYRLPWQGILIVIALYGSLLAFVTIRATPAYFLVAMAALELRHNVRAKPIAFTLLATLFHSSTLLALPAILAAIYWHKFKILRSLEAKPGAFLITLIFLAMLSIFGNEQIINIISALVDQFSGQLGRLSVYTAGSDVGSTNQVFRSSSHIYYALISSLFFIIFIFFGEKDLFRVRVFMLVSFMTFVALQFQPAAAFRQSISWMVPMLLLFPWKRFELGGLGNVLLSIFCIFIAMFSLSGVLL